MRYPPMEIKRRSISLGVSRVDANLVRMLLRLIGPGRLSIVIILMRILVIRLCLIRNILMNQTRMSFGLMNDCALLVRLVRMDTLAADVMIATLIQIGLLITFLMNGEVNFLDMVYADLMTALLMHI
jgi:hypothetical protein